MSDHAFSDGIKAACEEHGYDVNGPDINELECGWEFTCIMLMKRMTRYAALDRRKARVQKASAGRSILHECSMQEKVTKMLSQTHVPATAPKFGQVYATEDNRTIFADKSQPIGAAINQRQAVPTKCTRMSKWTRLRMHWLSLHGIQPIIVENPVVLQQENKEAVMEKSTFRNITSQELSMELQAYYQRATEKAISSDEGVRLRNLRDISRDPGIGELLPRFVAYIVEGIRVNIVRRDVTMLSNLLQLTKALISNTNIQMDNHLHYLLPVILSCALSRSYTATEYLLNVQPTAKFEQSEWRLRDMAASIIGMIVKTYNDHTNTIQNKVIRLCVTQLRNVNFPFDCAYGAISIIDELGSDVTVHYLLPMVLTMKIRFQRSLSGKSNDSVEAAMCYSKLSSVISVVRPAMTDQNPEDNVVPLRTMTSGKTGSAPAIGVDSSDDTEDGCINGRISKRRTGVTGQALTTVQAENRHPTKMMTMRNRGNDVQVAGTKRGWMPLSPVSTPVQQPFAIPSPTAPPPTMTNNNNNAACRVSTNNVDGSVQKDPGTLLNRQLQQTGHSQPSKPVDQVFSNFPSPAKSRKLSTP